MGVLLLAGHDFNAGLLFTTAEQILDLEAETNSHDVIASPLSLVASSTSSSSDADDSTSTLTNSTSSDRISSNSNSTAPNQQQQQPTFEFDFGAFFRLNNSTSSINKNESNE